MSMPTGYLLSRIVSALGATREGGSDDPTIRHVAIDSRKSFPAEGTLFFALRGDRHDGHRYIPSMIERGVRCFVVDEDYDATSLKDGKDLHLVRVADTKDALQRSAAWHRSHFHVPVIGITGSNGKTVVKEWLFHLLREEVRIVRSPGSWNSQVGVPLSVWNMGPEHGMGMFEAGISLPGEMARLRPVIKPTVGIFTNIGPAHGENFGSDREKALEKAQLFSEVDVLVYCADHEVVADAVDRSQLDQRVLLRPWSREKYGWLHLAHEARSEHGTRISVINDLASFTFTIPFVDRASVENAMHCVTLLLHLGYSAQWIMDRMPHLPPVAMRLEVVAGIHQSTLINDAYSNDLASLAIALDHLSLVGHGTRKMVVLTDIAESGDAPDLLHTRLDELLERGGVEELIAIGPELARHRDRFHCRMHDFPDADALLERFDTRLLEGATVLVKGARAFAMERVVERWQQKVHGTVLEIDLEAIRHNLNHFRSITGKEVRIMAMVKAFGYGSGALELARLFVHEQVHYLGVAYADEGIELRQQGIQLPILVMNPEPMPFEVLRRFTLEAEIYDMRTLDEAMTFARLHPDVPPVHLKLDTGMNRLGFTESSFKEALTLLREGRGPRIASVLSHLVGSEDPRHDAFTREQIERFRAMADALDTVLGYRPMRHIANSAAISRFPDAHMDMVRLGIGLHGIGHNASETAQLRAAATLRSPIAQLRTIKDGSTVGYGRSWRADGERLIATLPIGYADGLSRRLGNGSGRVWIKERPAPIVGNVCMDMMMVDVTGIRCEVGDMAYVFDPQHPISDLARDMGTIPYEVLTSISQRVKRIYVQG